MPTDFFYKVISIIRAIPIGKVMSYGSIAETAGNSRASRQVSRILHSSSGAYALPWHRVVNKSGCVVLKGEGFFEQCTLLKNEGIDLTDSGCIPEQYFWTPKNILQNTNDFYKDIGI